MPNNGEILVSPVNKGIAPLSVTVKGDADYYIYLKYLRFPSGTEDHTLPSLLDKANDMSFYVRAGMTASVDVPAGIYALYYASGKNWRDVASKFGDETDYFKADDEFEFYTKGSYVYGSTVELIPQTNGNLDYHNIKNKDFPG